MAIRSAVFLILIVLFGCSGVPKADGNTFEGCTEPRPSEVLTNECRWQIIEKIWENRRPWLEEYIRSTLQDVNGEGLYRTQLYTNGLFVAAVDEGRIDLVDSLSEVYLIAAEYLQEVNTYKYFYVPGGDGRVTELPLPKPTHLWLSWDSTGASGFENILQSAQFLFLVANAIASVEANLDLTPTMQKLIDTYWPVLIEHYERWIFSHLGPFVVRGWGCEVGNFNHSEFIDAKLKRSLGDEKSYCNAVTDTDLWIVAGVVEVLAAAEAGLKLSPDLHDRLLNYARRGVELIESRTQATALTNFDGRRVAGAVFDAGAWDEHPTYAYSGYSGETFPTEADKKAAVGVGWDFSHAVRYVEVFESLYRRRGLLGTHFPDREVMTELSNQLSYKIFNADFNKPLFANYFDGTNGWFRIRYDDREGFGYAPFDMSASMFYGSYGRWSEFNDDVAKIMRALWKMILSEQSDVIEHRRDHYEYRFYNKLERRSGDDILSLETSIQMLPFLSAFPSLN